MANSKIPRQGTRHTFTFDNITTSEYGNVRFAEIPSKCILINCTCSANENYRALPLYSSTGFVLRFYNSGDTSPLTFLRNTDLGTVEITVSSTH